MPRSLNTFDVSAEKPFAVNIWNTNPQAGNDDCLTGDNFVTREEAEAAFNTALLGTKGALGSHGYCTNWEFAELDGPDVYLIATNPRFSAALAARTRREEDSEWRREVATQAGMAGGCEAYNEAMGW